MSGLTSPRAAGPFTPRYGRTVKLAADNHWSGIVINGCIRDTEEIANTAVGVKALATHPMKSIKKGVGDRDIPVHFAGVTFEPGAFLYADEDGVLISSVRLDADN